MVSAVSQPWDAGSEADSLVVTYCADANDTLMPLVRLGDVPTDGTWEVLHAVSESHGVWWVALYDGAPLADGADGSSALVVARPIRSGE
jgi:hypothetical protein